MPGRRPLLCTYYPGHHPVPGVSWSEWELVLGARPCFPGHAKPDRPAWGPLADDEPATVRRQVTTAAAHGIDGFLCCWWWRPSPASPTGETLRAETLEQALLPLLAAPGGPDFSFAPLWVPCWPRHRLPVRLEDPELGDLERFFPIQPGDLVALLRRASLLLAHPAAFRVRGRPLLVFFHAWRLVEQLGRAGTASGLATLRALAQDELGLPGLFLVASINGLGEEGPLVGLGFDSFTSYVWWPDWHGARFQDYGALTAARARDWRTLQQRLEVPYLPSVCVGWDATPRGVSLPLDAAPRRFPWSPVITGRSPERFALAVQEGLRFLDEVGTPRDHPLLVASWNEWSEGHYLEPDERHGSAYLESLARLRGLPRSLPGPED